MFEATGYLSVADACQHLSISHSYFYMLVKRGDLTPVKLGRRTLVPRTEIARILSTWPENGATSTSVDIVSADTAKHIHNDI
jgi:excisionase family DNA binding protein